MGNNATKKLAYDKKGSPPFGSGLAGFNWVMAFTFHARKLYGQMGNDLLTFCQQRMAERFVNLDISPLLGGVLHSRCVCLSLPDAAESFFFFLSFPFLSNGPCSRHGTKRV